MNGCELAYEQGYNDAKRQYAADSMKASYCDRNHAFCPNHRDKQTPGECLSCKYEVLKDLINDIYNDVRTTPVERAEAGLAIIGNKITRKLEAIS